MQGRLPHETHAPHPTDRSDEEMESLPDGSTHVDARGLRRWARIRGWKLPITDGPFAESKEMLGG